MASSGSGGGGAGGGEAIPCGVSGEWSVVATEERGRYAPGVALLPDGSALVAGGWDASHGAQSTAVRFDPSTNEVSSAGKLASARNFPAVAVLPDGLLFAGGFNDGAGSMTSADVWSFGGAKLSATGKMVEARELFSATGLPDGRALVVGGLSAVGLKVRTTAEIYDAATGAFALTTTAPVEPRFGQAALLVPEKNAVFLVGGKTIGPGGDIVRSSSEWFDLDTGTFSLAGEMATARDRPVILRIDAGHLLVAGGANGADGSLSSTEIFDLASGAFSSGPPMGTRRMAHSAAVLGDGKVVIVGGWSDSTSPAASTAAAEIFDPSSMTFSPLPAMADARHDAGAMAVAGCSVVVVGGIQVDGDVSKTPSTWERIDLR